MRAFLLTGVLLGSIVLAGCLDPGNPVDDADQGLLLGLLAGEPLWNDPQNAPHPAFGWPTLSSPANATEVPAFWGPIPAAELPSPITGIEAVGQSPSDIRRAGGIALFGSIAVVPGYGKPSTILDISDPTNPKNLSSFTPQDELFSSDPQVGKPTHRGATIIAYPDGRLVTVISTSRGLDVWNLTDPTDPQPLPPIHIRSHKVGVVPGTPIVYNAASGGGGAANADGPGGRTADTGRGTTGIYDLTDPAKPIHVQNFTNGFSCHHVYFWNNPAEEKYRAICAGIEYTQLWDTSDPRDPKVIVSVPVHHGAAGTPSGAVTPAAFSHFAGLSLDGKTLLVGDEMGGGGLPPGCVASVETPAGAVSTPIGALWFYDVSSEKNPRLLGWYSPLNDPRVKAQAATSCTAHHGRLVPTEGRDTIAMSFYGAGVVLVDFTDVDFAQGKLPTVVDQFARGSDVWETWYNQGYLFTGDLYRGVDVLKFT